MRSGWHGLGSCGQPFFETRDLILKIASLVLEVLHQLRVLIGFSTKLFPSPAKVHVAIIRHVLIAGISSIHDDMPEELFTIGAPTLIVYDVDQVVIHEFSQDIVVRVVNSAALASLRGNATRLRFVAETTARRGHEDKNKEYN